MKRFCQIIREHIDNAIAGGTKAQIWWFTLVVVLIITGFSIIAIFAKFNIFDGTDTSTRIQGVIYHFIDPGNQSMEKGQPLFVQIFTFLVSFLGMIFLNGILISAITNTIERRVSNIERGLVTYKSIKNHIIIIGYSEMTISLINNELRKHNYKSTTRGFFKRIKRNRTIPKIIIFTNQDIQTVRASVYSQLPKGAEQIVLFYSGSIESAEHLSRLNIPTAQSMYILGDSDEYGRDSKNIACINHISNLRGDNEPLVVNVQFDLLPSYNNIKKLVIPDEYITPKNTTEEKSTEDDTPKEKPSKEIKPNIYFRPFNFYENWARLVWSSYADEKKYQPLDFDMMTGERHVHLFIVGFHRMGRAMLLEALRLCHYANYDPKNYKTRTQITVIDKDMDSQLASFKSQYPNIKEQIQDIDVEYINANVEDEAVVAMIDRVAHDEQTLLTIAICLNDPDLSLSTGLSLPDSCYFLPSKIDGDEKNIHENRMQTKILIRQELQTGIGDILDKDTDRFKNVRIFGMLSDGVSQQLFNDDLPMYINNNYDLLNGKDSSNFLSQYLEGKINKDNIDLTEARVSWIKLSENKRWANRYQVDAFTSYKKALEEMTITEPKQLKDIDDTQLEPLAKTEHRRWMAERTISGWRQIRPENGEKRMDKFQFHNLIIPYDKLDDDNKKKDITVIKNLLPLYKLFFEKPTDINENNKSIPSLKR